MILIFSKLSFTITIIFILLCGTVQGQICINRYSSIEYKGTTYDTITCSLVSANNEILSAGNLYDYNGAGHIVKYSAKGTPVWSYQYRVDYFDFTKGIFFKTIHFSNLISTQDGGYLVSGNVNQVLSPYGNPPPIKKHALLAKIDKFGNVLWNKIISNASGDLSFSTIIETLDGDIIAYLANDNGNKKLPGDHTYGRILRMDSKGAIKWSTLLFTFLFDAGGLGVNFKQGLTQARNKNIIVGNVVHKTDLANNKYRVHQGNLHFLELNYANGKIKWETSYEYPVPPSDSLYTPNIVHAEELPDGRFSFITTLYLNTGNSPAFTKKGAYIITDSKGKIENITAFYPSGGNSCKIQETAVNKITGNKTLWFKNEGSNLDLLTNISGIGQIIWSKGYSNNGGRFPINSFSAGKTGYNIFTGNNATFYTGLLVTDATGVIDCVNVPADMVAEQAVFNYPQDSVITDITIRFDDYYDFAYPFKRKEEYPLAKNIDCQQTTACCTDLIDSVNFNYISICEGKSYMLPDSTIIKDSGTYYVTFKTPLGCDSIRYYRINTEKDIAKLSLGKDTCLTQSTSIKLLATPGYNKYYWVNKNTPDSNVFTINRPGNYWVTVSNTCGTKTDSITIYDQCDYPAYMPKAFTPNNDQLNDVYRISPLNKNRLISFKIFDRWGKLVFKTSDPHVGWDGNFHNEPLPSDTFVYYLEMEGFSGKRITERSSFLLLR